MGALTISRMGSPSNFAQLHITPPLRLSTNTSHTRDELTKPSSVANSGLVHLIFEILSLSLALPCCHSPRKFGSLGDRCRRYLIVTRSPLDGCGKWYWQESEIGPRRTLRQHDKEGGERVLCVDDEIKATQGNMLHG